MNPELPLPTDSYYKFCALAGVAIVLVSVYFPATPALDIDEQRFNIRMEVAVTGVKVEHLKKLLENNERTLNNLLSGKTEEQARAEGKLPVSITPLEFLRHEFAVRIGQDLAVSVEKSKIKIEREKQPMGVYHFVVGFVCIVGVSVGARLAMFGFTNWYTKFQLPLDSQNSSDAQQVAPGDGVSTTTETK